MCLRILDVNPKYRRNPGKDCSGRRNPIYVSRVLSAMVRITFLQLCSLCYALIWSHFVMHIFIQTHTQIHTHRWTVMTEIMGYWKAAGSKLLKVESVPCPGEGVWRFSRLGTPLLACLSALASAGCSLQLPALVRIFLLHKFFAVRQAWDMDRRNSIW